MSTETASNEHSASTDGYAFSHAELVERAGRWLKNSCCVTCWHDGKKVPMRCGVVATELVTTASETPDAIGFSNAGRNTVLIEVKVSRADFLADAKKFFRRRPQYGMGMYRYYMTPPGLIDTSELPEGWGLLECDKRIRIVQLAAKQAEWSERYETAVLYSLARRSLEA